MKFFKSCFILIIFILIASGCNSDNKEINYENESFISIPQTRFTWKRNQVFLKDYEICDHPVTNQEYKGFIKATGYKAPPYWKNGEFPKGKSNYPVIFVNRDDAEEYSRWLSETTGRIHRLPTNFEFLWAACSGNIDAKYPWGDNSEIPATAEVNFNSDGTRKYNEWSKYLIPANSGYKNNFGLFNMTGNIWQLVEENIDPETATYKFRIETLVSNNRFIMGGSWCSPKEYLASGITYHSSPGIKLPDLGFRMVKEPLNSNWAVKPRGLCCTTNENGCISLSWAALKDDHKSTAFNIYRITGSARNQAGQKINNAPVFNTSYLDTLNIVADTRYQYRVVEVTGQGVESHPSEWTGVVASNLINPVILRFKPLFQGGSMTPVFGDLEGWNKIGCVVRLSNGNSETSQDPGIPVQLEAFSSTGKSLWRKDIAHHNNIFGSASNAPFNVWDMNGDGKDEVITLLQKGEENFIAILNGMSGKSLFTAPWTPMATDISRSSTRIQMSIAYLNGISPSVITQTGIYENEIISAYDNELNKLWEFESFLETNGSGGHKIEVADVDGDGKDEIIYGTTCLNPDGTIRWSIYRQHPDLISIHDYLPERPGPEVCYIVESSVHAGIYMVDANTGELIWKNNREDDPEWSHGHIGWTADILESSVGIECITNRAGHNDKNLILFSAGGKRLMESFPTGHTPVEWDGDPGSELLSNNGKTLSNFNGEIMVPVEGAIPNPIPDARLIFTADLFGDFRSELVVSSKDMDGKPVILVLSATEPINQRYLAASENREYRLWLAHNMGGGYGQVTMHDLIQLDD